MQVVSINHECVFILLLLLKLFVSPSIFRMFDLLGLLVRGVVACQLTPANAKTPYYYKASLAVET